MYEYLKTKQPKLAEYKHFNEDDHEYVKRINYYFLDQYYDSHSKAERITLSKMLANKVYLQNKINLQSGGSALASGGGSDTSLVTGISDSIDARTFLGLKESDEIKYIPIKTYCSS